MHGRCHVWLWSIEFSNGSRRPRTETASAHQWGKPVASSRQTERCEAAKERRSEQHPYHPQPKPSSVQSAVGSAHQELHLTATNEHARTVHQPSPNPSSARNQPSASSVLSCLWRFTEVSTLQPEDSRTPLFKAIVYSRSWVRKLVNRPG